MVLQFPNIVLIVSERPIDMFVLECPTNIEVMSPVHTMAM